MFAAIVAALVGAAVLAIIYGVAVVYLPKIGYVKLVLIFGCLMVVGFAFAVGGLTGALLKWARVRSPAMIALVGLLAAAAALYVSWVTWETLVMARFGYEVVPHKLLARPDGVWSVARMINDTGTIVYGNEETPIRGPFLWVLWAVEAALVLGIASQVPVRMLRHLSFCEPCDRWCDKHQGVLSVNYGDEAALKSRLERKDFAAFRELGAADMDAAHRFRVDLDDCHRCGQTHLLSVFRIDVTYKQGNRQEKAVRVLDRLRLTGAEAQVVRDIRDAFLASDVPAAPAPQDGDDEEGEDEPGERETRA